MGLFVKQCQRCILLYGKIAIKPDIICKGKASSPHCRAWPEKGVGLTSTELRPADGGEPEGRSRSAPAQPGSKDGQMKQAELNNQVLTVGIDIGSTTTKIVALSADGGETLF